MSLYYFKEDNVFMDGEGELVFEIFEIITPNDLYLFKQNKKTFIVNHCTDLGYFVELYWPDAENESYSKDVNRKKMKKRS